METKISEISDGIYRLSTFVSQIAPPAGFTFNQFLILGEEPLLFHTGLRRMFPAIRSAVSRIVPPERLRWIGFGHYEADECGAMNEWLAVAPRAEVTHGQTGCMVSLNDMADRPPRVLQDGQTIDLGNGLDQRFLPVWVLLDRFQQRIHLRISRFLARQCRSIREHGRQFIEELFGEHPFRFRVPGR